MTGAETGEERGTALLADVGGTNTRVALLRGGKITAPAAYENDGFSGLLPLLRAYLSGRPAPARCCIAIAGPVGPGVARLTNRDWVIAPEELAPAMGLPDPQAVTLVNDLTALALALPDLRADQVAPLRPAAGTAGNGQALVANFGTGFNVGLLRATAAGPQAWAAELGHAALPAPLAAEAGPSFPTVEHLFSGAGLARLHVALGGAALTPRAVIAGAAAGEAPAGRTVARMGRLMGLFARELVFTYLPRDGIYIAGSMGRAVLEVTGRQAFLDAFAAPGPAATLAAGVPLRIVTDDAAALGGLARLAGAAQ